MAGRWFCRLTGVHRWSRREGAEGRYRQCLRCDEVSWFVSDDRSVDLNEIPRGGLGAVGGGIGGDGGGGG